MAITSKTTDLNKLTNKERNTKYAYHIISYHIISYYIISYRGEILNLDNVIYAKPISDSCIRLELVGSTGVGNSRSYSVKHRQMNLPWSRAVLDEFCQKAGVIFF